MNINAAWHNKHILGKNADLAHRINWHLAHQEHCKCRPISASVAAAIKGKQVKTCSRGHYYIDADSCPICWPSGQK